MRLHAQIGLLIASNLPTSAVAAECFGNTGTCYAVIGSVRVNDASGSASYAHYNSITSATATVGSGSPRASSSVDLSTGSIRVFGTDSQSYVGFGANGSLYETIKFDLPEGMDGVSVPVTFRLHGFNTHRPYASYNNIGLTFQIASYGNLQHFSRFAESKYCGFDAAFTEVICKPGEVEIEYTGNLTLWEDVYYQVQMTAMIGGSSMTQDYTNTAGFSWILPQGVTYQSGSGVFLSALASGVPEPHSWAMMIAGFGIIGGAMRIRRQMIERRVQK